MSVLDYQSPRRSLPYTPAVRTFYYNERHEPIDITYNPSLSSHNYPLRDAYASPTSRRDETFHQEGGHVRRRISIACARCRKRKIKCSGPSSNGSGCGNCVQAGVDSTQCQFHRVGSDNVENVIENISKAQTLTGLANASGMVPAYSTNNNPYPRPTLASRYHHLDTKSSFSPTWTAPYHEESSPIARYHSSQTATYIPQQRTHAGANHYAPLNRHSRPASRPLPNGTSAYAELAYGNCDLPHIQIPFHSTTAGSVSPFDMGSLQSTLVEGSRPQQHLPSEIIPPQKQLPIPRTSHGPPFRYGDQLQDQHFPLLKAPRRPNKTAGDTFAKSPRSWSGNKEKNVFSSNAPSTESLGIAPKQALSLKAERLSYASASATDVLTSVATSQPLPFNFSTSSLLDTVSASVPIAPYSNFRKYHGAHSPSTETLRHGIQTNPYSVSSDITMTCNSHGGTSTKDRAGVPSNVFPHFDRSQAQIMSPAGNLPVGSFDNRDMSDLNAKL